MTLVLNVCESCNVLSKIAYFLHHFIVLVRAYCVIELFVGLIHWYGLKWSDDRDELNVFKSASFFQIYRTERSDVPAGPVTQLPIWCPPFDPRKPGLVYKFGYVVYTHSMFEHSCSLTWIHVLSYYTYCLRQYLFIYAPGSNDQGHIVFVLSICLFFFVCLFVCLSVCCQL